MVLPEHHFRSSDAIFPPSFDQTRVRRDIYHTPFIPPKDTIEDIPETIRREAASAVTRIDKIKAQGFGGRFMDQEWNDLLEERNKLLAIFKMDKTFKGVHLIGQACPSVTGGIITTYLKNPEASSAATLFPTVSVLPFPLNSPSARALNFAGSSDIETLLYPQSPIETAH